MRKKYLITSGIIGLVLILDQLFKYYIQQNFLLYQSRQLIKNFFHLTYIQNRGGIFGFWARGDSSFLPFLFILISLSALVFLLFLWEKIGKEKPSLISAFSLIMGGALGNLLDRIRLGAVIDFIDLHWHSYHWPAFNLADSAITLGALLLLKEALKGSFP